MGIEKSQIKFVVSDKTGETVGFVSRHSKTKLLKGVRENSQYGKKICVLAEHLKGSIIPNILYEVELKPMLKGNGYVVVSAVQAKFKALIETIIVPKSIYQVIITFGNKTFYYDPVDGKSPSSRTMEGVLKLLESRNDIEDLEEVIADFRKHARVIKEAMSRDGYYHASK
jgi:hypothetical protein